MTRTPIALLALAALLAGCNRDSDSDTSASSDSASQSDSAIDTDTDTDTDTGTDTDTDTDTNTPPTCDDPGTPAPGSASGLGACYTRELSCGDVVTDTTTGGHSNFSAASYETAWCRGNWPTDTNWDSPEREYFIQVPEGKEAVVTLTTPDDCVQSGIEVRASFGSPTGCDGLEQGSCDASKAAPNTPGGRQLRLAAPDQSRGYHIVVDGADGAEGVFTLQIEC